MDSIGRGIVAGFLATLLLSALFDPAALLARMAGVLPPASRWFAHFLIFGLIWGACFPVVRPLLRGPTWARGVEFGFLAWLVVMVTVMPFTHGGLFGLDLGFAAPAVTLAAHVVYGALVGAIFVALDPHDTDHHDEQFHPLAH